MDSIIKKMIEFKSNDHMTPGYIAKQDHAGNHPGLIIIQEWWGLVPHIKDVTVRFAGEGFIT
jgi:carboxymethylenebutenolidase